MSFTLPGLTYPHSALEPHIDRKTMLVHHGKHHHSYVNKLNQVLENHPNLQTKSLEDLLTNIANLPKEVSQAVRNTAGGHFNHSMFWKIISPQGGGEPQGELAKGVLNTFSSFAKFQKEFAFHALSLFGSGWTWLVKDGNKLVVLNTSNQDCPLSNNQTPLLCLDLWEHAYYLKYQSSRSEYIKAFWNLVDWNQVEKRYLAK